MKIISPNRAEGFTLIELLVVIAIIGILSTIVMSSMSKARAQSRDGKRLTDIKSIQLAVGLYYDANNKYPINISQSTLTGYISSVPVDPSSGSGTTYQYTYIPYCASTDLTSPISYHIGTSLENAGNANLSQDNDVSNFATSTFVACTGGAGTDFSGADSAKCATTDPGTNCFDVTP